MTASPPDGGWGWIIVGSSLMCNIIVDGIGLAYGVLLPKFSEYFDARKSEVSLVGTVLVGIYSCTGPIHGGLVNKFGCRVVCIAGSILSASGFIIASFSSSLNMLILCYGVVGGTGFGMLFLSALVSVERYFEKKRPLATGIAFCGAGIGGFIFSPLLEYLSEIFEWRSMLVIVAGIILNGAVFGMLLRPLRDKITKPPSLTNFIGSSKEPQKTECNVSMETQLDSSFSKEARCKPLSVSVERSLRVSDERSKDTTSSCFSYEQGTPVTSNFKWKNVSHSINRIFDFSLYCNLSFDLLSIGSIFGIGAYYIPVMYLVDRALLLGVDSTDAVWLMSTIGIMNIVGRLFAGGLASLKSVNKFVLNNIALLMAAVSLFVLPLLTTYVELLVFCVVYGLCVASYVTLVPILLCEVLGVERFASGFGHQGVARGLASVVIPLIAGILYQTTGNYDASFYFGGGLFLAAFIVHLPINTSCFQKYSFQKSMYVVNVD